MLCCLLSAQWLGLGHRVAHAGWTGAGQAAKATVFSSSKSSDIPPTVNSATTVRDDNTAPEIANPK